MLLRLITIISLFMFILLMIYGVSINIALYRSILVFMILFTIIYLTIFLLNVIQGDSDSDNSAVTESNNNTQNEEEN